MQLKKLGSMALAVALAFSLAVPVFADNPTGSVEGEGEVEFVYNENIFNVVLPTTTDSTLDFTLDPKGVLNGTDQTNYPNAKTLYFGNANATPAYSDTSDVMTIKNKSTFKVDVTVDAVVTGLTVGTGSDAKAATMSADSGFTTATSHIYLALMDEESGSQPKAIVASDGTVKAQLTKTGMLPVADATSGSDTVAPYIVSKDASGNYKYDWNGAYPEASIPVYKFKLTGASNPAADWTGLKDLKPVVKLTWTVAPAASETTLNGNYDDKNVPPGPSVDNVTFVAGQAFSTTVNWTDDATSILNLIVTTQKGTSVATSVNVNGNTLSFDTAHSSWIATEGGSATYEVTFNNNEKVTFTATVRSN